METQYTVGYDGQGRETLSAAYVAGDVRDRLDAIHERLCESEPHVEARKAADQAEAEVSRLETRLRDVGAFIASGRLEVARQTALDAILTAKAFSADAVLESAGKLAREQIAHQFALDASKALRTRLIPAARAVALEAEGARCEVMAGLYRDELAKHDAELQEALKGAAELSGALPAGHVPGSLGHGLWGCAHDFSMRARQQREASERVRPA